MMNGAITSYLRKPRGGRLQKLFLCLPFGIKSYLLSRSWLILFKSYMGYIYEAMEKAKEIIMKSFNNDESKYNYLFTIIDNRWTCQLNRPLHAASHFLNLEFFYSNPDMEYNLEVTNGLYDCIKRLVPSKDAQHFFLTKLPLYKSANVLFGDDFAKESRKTTTSGETLKHFLNCAKI